MTAGEKLIDLGEGRIVSQLIAPRCPPLSNVVVGVGDDGAVLSVPAGHDVVVTIDPCPTPVIWLLGNADYYHHGWLTVVINVSDLAAMGATPLGMTVSTMMRPDMRSEAFVRFMDGLVAASHAFNCPIVGGNIKDGDRFEAVGSAFGAVLRTGLTLRRGLRAGDRICVIGEMGLFWAAVLSVLQGGGSLPPCLHESLHRPVPRVRESMELAKLQVVTACIDCSDGLQAGLSAIAQASRVDIVVDSEALHPHPDVRRVAESAGIDARKLMFAWGDWELIVGLPDSAVGLAREATEAVGGPFWEVGEVHDGNGTVWLKDGARIGELSAFASMRFSESSYMIDGLDPYVDILRHRPLTTGPAPTPAAS